VTADAPGGQVAVLFHNAPIPPPHLKLGVLRGIEITTAKRSLAGHDLPTSDRR